MTQAAETVVIDASALVDLLAGTDCADAVAARLKGTVLHAPTHLDAEVLSALGRLHRAGELSATKVEDGLRRVRSLPVTRHALPDLLIGSWQRRSRVRLVDALYVQLATLMGAQLLTTDQRLARTCPSAEALCT